MMVVMVVVMLHRTMLNHHDGRALSHGRGTGGGEQGGGDEQNDLFHAELQEGEG